MSNDGKAKKDSLEEAKDDLVNRAEADKQAQKDETKHPQVAEVVTASDQGGDESEVQEIISLEDRIETAVLEEKMRESYLSYAMSVIVSRALPDVRDGLKPVHRRILYTMHKLGLTPGAKYVKSARVIGDVLGKYHPHGDSAVYNAMVRMAQEFSLRYPLVDGQGNFGSIDGDSPAAMRYTEARMAGPATYLLRDIEKETVDFADNYDGSQKEPTVLPNILPNFLINGTTGIAVGMATEVPPHNLQEVTDAALHLLENPEASIEDLMEYIKGPDLPTGGILYGKEDLLAAYKTGRGRAVLQSKAHCEEDRIIVTEIPYQMNKADQLVKISHLVRDKKLEGIKDIRDESNKEGVRIVFETKRDASPEVVLNQLYKQTDLQTAIHFNLLALVNGGRQPKLLNLKEILFEFIQHRYDVVTRRTQYELDQAEARLHILDGLKIALDFIDEVIALIRSSYDKEEATRKLMERFDFSEKQTEAILQMRLQTLTNLDKSKIESERDALLETIAGLKEILENPEVKKALIADEIKEVAAKFNNPRRTKIIEHSLNNYNKEDFVEEQDVLVQLTNSQYLKVLPIDTFRTQGRGGRGVTSFNPKDEDWVKSSIIANTHDYVYAFTNTGRVFRTRVFELPTGTRQSRGQSLVNYFQLQEDEKITNILTLTKDQENDQTGSLIFLTQNGLVKRTKLDLYANIRKTGIIAIGLNEGDKLLDVKLSLDAADNIIISSDAGKTIIFDREKLNPLGRTAKGVKGIKLKKGQKAINLSISNAELIEGVEEDDGALIEEEKVMDKVYPSLLVVTENGYGKQTKIEDYRKTNRAASGVKTLNMTKKTGKPVVVELLYGEEEALVLTTKNGVTIKVDPDKISQLGRSTQGVKVINLDKKDVVVSGGVS